MLIWLDSDPVAEQRTEFWIRDILLWIRMRIRILGSGPFVSANKNIFLLSFSAYSLLKVHLRNSSKIKSHKEVTKQWKSRVLIIFCLLTEGSGSLQISYGSGCGSRRAKSKRIRIRMRIRYTDCGI